MLNFKLHFKTSNFNFALQLQTSNSSFNFKLQIKTSTTHFSLKLLFETANVNFKHHLQIPTPDVSSKVNFKFQLQTSIRNLTLIRLDLSLTSYKAIAPTTKLHCFHNIQALHVHYTAIILPLNGKFCKITTCLQKNGRTNERMDGRSDIVTS